MPYIKLVQSIAYIDMVLMLIRFRDPEALVVKKPAILLLEHFIKFEIYK